MKRLIALFLICLVGFVAWRTYDFFESPLNDKLAEPVVVELPKGTSFQGAVRILAQEQLLSEPLMMRIYARAKKADGKIKAGFYTIDPKIKPSALLDLLVAGDVPGHRVTLKEGLTRWQVADLLAESGLVEREAFLDRVEKDKLEGRLFPDTYYFSDHPSLDEILGRMTARFNDVFESLCSEFAEICTAENREKLIILASLVEREAKTERDRGLCSRVFWNRLAQNMKLQSDPTCVYGMARYKEVPTPVACRDSSNLYNTYAHVGLPPGPIANPGRAALRAAMAPTSTPESLNLLYFVTKKDGSGEHVFSETYEQHKKALAESLEHLQK